MAARTGMMTGTIKEKREHSLAIRCFGHFEARVSGHPLRRLHTRKGLWLMALLIFRRGAPAERGWLAGTLWPESGEAEALANLRNCLNDLRRALGPEACRLLSPTARSLSLDLSAAECDLI